MPPLAGGSVASVCAVVSVVGAEVVSVVVPVVVSVVCSVTGGVSTLPQAVQSRQAASSRVKRCIFISTYWREARVCALPTLYSLCGKPGRCVVGDLLFVRGFIGCFAEQDAVLIERGVLGQQRFLLVFA